MIEELEKEKTDLLKLIDEAVKEQEFLSAHFHFEALRQVNRQLQTLRNLDDELYDKKYFLRIGIENAKKRLIDETEEYLRRITTRSIEQREKELSELNQAPKKQKDINSKSQLRDCLELFLRKKARGLRIIFSKVDSLSIEITNSKDGIKLTMPNINKLQAKSLLTEDRLFKLKGLGFSLNDKGDKTTAILKVAKNEVTEKIMRLISIIVFEVFYFKELGREAAIEIINKRTSEN